MGPPELPRLIAASICRKSSYGPRWMLRPRQEMIPLLSVEPERVPDRDYPIADPRSIAVAPTDIWQRMVHIDLEKREIRFGVAPDDLGPYGASPLEQSPSPFRHSR